MTLKEAGVTLIDCDHRTPPPATDGYPYVTIPNMRDGRITFEGARRITRERFVEWTKKAAPGRDDVVLSRRCNPGVTAVVAGDQQFALGQNLVLLRSNGVNIHPPFLRWLTRGEEWWEQVSAFNNVGAVFDSLRCADIPKFELPVPPKDEQRAIAHILGTLDDKIEVNRRMNETMEATAKTLFRAFFIDYVPVATRAEGQSSRIHQQLADLFPESFEESSIGEIPSGWKIKGLDELAGFLNGLALQKYPPDGDHSMPVIKIAQLRAGSTLGADRCGTSLPEEFVIHDGDILFSWSGSLECVLWAGGKGGLNQHIFKVTSDRYPRWLCYLAIHVHLNEFRHIAAGKATTMGHIQRHHLSDAKLAVPSRQVIEAMDAILSPMIESLWKREVESRTLVSLRDTLLPKLISGELRVKDAERIAARAI